MSQFDLEEVFKQAIETRLRAVTEKLIKDTVTSIEAEVRKNVIGHIWEIFEVFCDRSVHFEDRTQLVVRIKKK